MTPEPPSQILADQVSRTDLLLGRRGAVNSLTDVRDWFDERPVYVHIDPRTAVSGPGQSALITLVTLLHRAGFPVITPGSLDAACIEQGPFRGQNLARTLTSLGAVVESPIDGERPGRRVVVIGEVEQMPAPSVQLTWDGWIAAVRPGGTRLEERDGCPVAPLLAAALTASEIFESHLGVRDACWREVTISLWNPTGASSAQGPAVMWLPQQLMLVGLGHLGQAHAWCLAHLPYPSGAGEIWLADDERVTASNVSTGVFTAPDHLAEGAGVAAYKTRLVAERLERAGLATRLIERRIHSDERHHPDLPPIALVGVDNLATRRAISDFGWPLCVDAGLGSTASSFDTFALHVFDGKGRASSEIEAWYDRPPVDPDTDAPIFDALRTSGVDDCGLVTLANKSVACAYVGMAAACFAVAEVLRRLNGNTGISAMSAALDAIAIRGDCVASTSLRAPTCRAATRDG